MRKILAAFLLLPLLLSSAIAQTGTAQTKGQLNTEQGTNFPDNTSGLITPAILRQTMVDFIASWEQAGKVRTVTGGTDTWLATDTGWLINYTTVGAVAVTAPQATGNFAIWDATVCASGTGNVTITPTTSTINGAATFVLVPGQCSHVYSDSANYQATTNTRKNPTTSFVTAGAHTGGFGANSSGTYTTPINATWIEIWMVGGGGAGGGSGGTGGNGGNTCWNTTGAACTTPVYQAGGGGGGAATTTGTGGTAGTIAGSSTCTIALAGTPGTGAPNNGISGSTSSGGAGGDSIRLGHGASAIGNTTGQTAQADTGSGGQGSGSAATVISAGGGASGAMCYVLLTAPAATYTYAVGAAGTAAGAPAGGAGASGQIFVIEHYGS
jgi:hypothetical protein